MKTIFKLSILIAFVTLFIACTDDDPTTGSNSGSSLTAKVDGQDFASMEASASAIITNGVLALQGSDASGNFIRMNIMSYNGAGTYKSGDALSNTNSMSYGTVSPVQAWTSTFNIGSGTLTVTSDDGSTIEGTFTFDGVDGSSTKSITNGKFRVAIQ